MINSINSDVVRTYVHLDKQNSFTKKRKIPLLDIILCTLFFLNSIKLILEDYLILFKCFLSTLLFDACKKTKQSI